MLKVYRVTPKGKEAAWPPGNPREGEVRTGFDDSGVYECVEVSDETTPPCAQEISVETALPLRTVQVILKYYIQLGFITEAEGTYEDLENALLQALKECEAKRSEGSMRAYRFVLKDLFRARHVPTF